jgi:hypothetical protein
LGKPRITVSTLGQFESTKNGPRDGNKQIWDAWRARIDGGDTRISFGLETDTKKSRFHAKIKVSALRSAGDLESRVAASLLLFIKAYISILVSSFPSSSICPVVLNGFLPWKIGKGKNGTTVINFWLLLALLSPTANLGVEAVPPDDSSAKVKYQTQSHTYQP